MTTSIHTRRLGQLFRLDLFTNKSKYISFLTGCFIANVCAQYAIFYPLIHNAYRYNISWDTFGSQLYMFFNLLSTFILLLGASSVAEIFVSKRSRIYWLTLPASNLEKFLVRLILWIPGMFLAHIATFAVVDLLRQGLFAIFSTPTLSGISYVASVLCDTTQRIGHIATQDVRVPMWLSIECMILGFYLLGSTYFYKRAFIKTSVCLILLGVLLNIFGGIILGILYDQHGYVISGEDHPVGFAIFCGLIALACLILAYRRFKRTTIIQPKLFTLSLFRKRHEL